MALIMKKTKSLTSINQSYKKGGGTVLVEDDGTYLYIESDWDEDCFGRSFKYLESLAPSWSELHPDNIEKRKRLKLLPKVVPNKQPIQLRLF